MVFRVRLYYVPHVRQGDLINNLDNELKIKENNTVVSLVIDYILSRWRVNLPGEQPVNNMDMRKFMSKR